MNVNFRDYRNFVSSEIKISNEEIEQKKETSKEVSLLKKAGVFAINLLPISSKGIQAVFVKPGLKIFKNLSDGFVQSVKGRTITAFSVKTSYTDITKMDDKEALKIVREGVRYAKKHQYSVKIKEDFPEAGGFQAVYENMDQKLQERGFKRDQNGVYYSTKTGTILNLSLDKKTKEVMVCFWGLGSQGSLSLDKKDEGDKMKILIASVYSAGFESLGKMGAAGLEAMKVGELLKNETSKKGLTPVILGHSHGGGLGQCAAFENGIKGVFFNARAMGTGMRNVIGQEKIEENSKNVTVFSTEGDWLTDNKLFNKLSAVYEILTGTPTPRNEGKKYLIPCIPDSDNPHNDYLRSLALLKFRLK